MQKFLNAVYAILQFELARKKVHSELSPFFF